MIINVDIKNSYELNIRVDVSKKNMNLRVHLSAQ